MSFSVFCSSFSLNNGRRRERKRAREREKSDLKVYEFSISVGSELVSNLS